MKLIVIIVLILLLTLLLRCLLNRKKFYPLYQEFPMEDPYFRMIGGSVTKYGQVYRINRADSEILRHLDIGEPITMENLAKKERLMTGDYCDVKLIEELFKAKDYIGEHFDEHKKYVDKVLPKNHVFQGKHYRYHTFIKLLQAFIMTHTNYLRMDSFFDVCGAPGEWTRSLLKSCRRVKRVYCVSLADHGGLPYDTEIVKNPIIKIISPHDGNIYKKSTMKEASDTIKTDVEFVVSDGGFGVESLGIDYNLQSLVMSHLLFAEFVYGLRFVRKNGCFVMKMFDTFDDLTVSLVMIATIFFREVYITKPIESRIINSERYLICKNLIRKDNEFIRKMIDLLDKTEKLNPSSIISKDIMRRQTDFNRSMKMANEAFIKTQTKAIYETVNKCIEMAKEAGKK